MVVCECTLIESMLVLILMFFFFFFCCVFVFFFQAEDGIRYLVRSRGLGDVYKRQRLPLIIRPVTPRFFTVGDTLSLGANLNNNTDAAIEATVSLEAVSYTHLTLPTSDLV